MPKLIIRRSGILFFLCLIFPFELLAQDANAQKEIQNKIDEEVWKTFMTAFESSDGPALNALYGPKVIRVTPNGLDISNEFKKENIKRFAAAKKAGANVDLDFWFEHRHTLSEASYEVGYFRISSEVSGQKTVFYGQFHIYLQRIEGSWKITQDWDNTFIKGADVTEEDFNRGEKGPFND